jgi:hypothetical protein
MREVLCVAIRESTVSRVGVMAGNSIRENAFSQGNHCLRT